MKKIIYAIVTILCFMFLDSCNLKDKRVSQTKNKPENKITEQVKNELESKIIEESKGVIKLQDFNMTDAKKILFKNTEAYELTFEAKIRFLSEGFKYDAFDNFEVMNQAHDVYDTIVSGNSTYFGNQEYFHEGQLVEITGKATFEKKGSDLNIDNIKIVNWNKTRD